MNLSGELVQRIVRALNEIPNTPLDGGDTYELAADLRHELRKMGPDLACPECGRNSALTCEVHASQWDPVERRWEHSDEITGPFTCHDCGYDSKHLDHFIAD